MEISYAWTNYLLSFVLGLVVATIFWLLLFERLEKTRRKRRRALQEHKALVERDFAPEECEEHHLAGDCPLCGAE